VPRAFLGSTLPVKPCMSPAFSTLDDFSDRVLCFLPKLALDHSPPTYAAHIAEITDMTHYSWPVF
jgi:hypothetical protein